MRLVYGTHPSFAQHDTGPHHPERPARLEAVERGVLSSGAEIVDLEVPPVDRELLEGLHTAEYVAALERFCLTGGGALDADTVAGPASWQAAIHAAGAGPAAVLALETGLGEAAFLAVRPPGHHAEPGRAMGFCLFNNVAVTAKMLVDRGERVAIVDWDVHHGNGTQSAFQTVAEVLYVSLHEFPLYPGSGWVEEIGEGAGAGTVLNLPFPAGTTGDVYREAFDDLVVPVVARFSPTWLLLSAGYDAHVADPLARIRLEAWDFGALASRLRSVVPEGRTVAFLEGGYDLEALAASVRETVAGLSGEETRQHSPLDRSPERAWLTLSLARSLIGPYYDL